MMSFSSTQKANYIWNPKQYQSYDEAYIDEKLSI